MSVPRPEHEPVLVDPLLAHLDPQPGMTLLDGTVGLGGHARILAERVLPGGRYIGLDADPAMLAVAQERLADLPGEAVTLVHANYAEFPEVLDVQGLQRVDALFLDLGVNSAQLADPVRGFSFEQEGPLDMRFDPSVGQPAVDLVNALGENELADLFYEFGQEGASRKIARRICQFRREGRITTTKTLAAAVESGLQEAGIRPGKIHPATRVFQALRVAVNREFENLRRFLHQALAHLSDGGRLAVISFHSLEDGIVKRFLRDHKEVVEEITRRPVTASPAERRRNPRSRSAKLRVARRVGSDG